ncbi:hypothetical protein BC940DRAFT_298490 [Gongronella butleri]|nr:hypothetical protein BC940DRAFT_298490 [Gongronella butleri]
MSNSQDNTHLVYSNVNIPLPRRVNQLRSENCCVELFDSKYVSAAIEREQIQQYLNDNRLDVLRVVIRRVLFYTYHGYREVSSCINLLQDMLQEHAAESTRFFVQNCLAKAFQDQDKYHLAHIARLTTAKKKAQSQRYHSMLKCLIEVNLFDRVQFSVYLSSETTAAIGIVLCKKAFDRRLARLQHSFIFRQVKMNICVSPPVSRIFMLLHHLIIESLNEPGEHYAIMPREQLNNFHEIINKYTGGLNQVNPNLLLDIMLDFCIDQAQHNVIFWAELIDKNKTLASSVPLALKGSNCVPEDTLSHLIGFKYNYLRGIKSEPSLEFQFTTAVLIHRKMVTLELLLPYLSVKHDGPASAARDATAPASRVTSRDKNIALVLAKILFLIGDAKNATFLATAVDLLESQWHPWVNAWIAHQGTKFYHTAPKLSCGFRFDSDTDEDDEEECQRAPANLLTDIGTIASRMSPLIRDNRIHAQDAHEFLNGIFCLLHHEPLALDTWMSTGNIKLLVQAVKHELTKGNSTMMKGAQSLITHAIFPALRTIPTFDPFTLTRLLPYQQRSLIYLSWQKFITSKPEIVACVSSQIDPNTCLSYLSLANIPGFSTLVCRHPTYIGSYLINQLLLNNPRISKLVMQIYMQPSCEFALDVFFALLADNLAKFNKDDPSDKENQELPPRMAALTDFTRRFLCLNAKNIRSSLFEYLALYIRRDHAAGRSDISHVNTQLCLYASGQSDDWKPASRLQKQQSTHQILGKRKSSPLGSSIHNNSHRVLHQRD